MRMPAAAELPMRIAPVLRVVYLVFNEGYAASAGETLTRHDLSAEAIRLGRLLVDELREMGVADAAQDEYGLVLATIPPTVARPAETIALGFPNGIGNGH